MALTKIGTTGIADDSITLAKMAGGTDGNLITYDTSGNPAYVATGSATHVLTSNGADTVPTFQAAAGGPSQATQSAIEAETNEDTYAPPDLIKNSPGVAKAWCQWHSGGTQIIKVSYNITSIADGGVGKTDITIATDFSTAEFVVVGQGPYIYRITHERDAANAAGLIDIAIINESNALEEGNGIGVAMFGDQ